MAEIKNIQNKIEKLIGQKRYIEAIEYVDHELNNTSDKLTQAMLLFEKGKAQYWNDQRDVAMQNITKSLSILEEFEDENLVGDLIFHIAGLYLLIGDLVNSKKIYVHLINKLPEGNKYRLGSMQNLAGIYRKSGDITKAKDYLKDTVSEAKKYGEEVMSAYSCENLSEIYAMQLDRENAKTWMEKAIDFAEKTNEQRILRSGKLALLILKDPDINKILEEGNKIKNNGMPYPHDVADIYYAFSSFTPTDSRKKLIEEAILLYSETGDGEMRKKAIEILEAMK